MENPIVGFHFFVEIQGAVVGAFRECSGLDSEHEVVEYKVSKQGGEEVTMKIPGRQKWSPIELKRGVTTAKDIYDWRKMVEDGKINEARKNGSVVLYDQTHTEVGRWNFVNAWPSKVTGPQLNSGNNDVAIEGLTIQHEGCQRV
jgi:phage tail-like protein